MNIRVIKLYTEGGQPFDTITIRDVGPASGEREQPWRNIEWRSRATGKGGRMDVLANEPYTQVMQLLMRPGFPHE